MAIRKILSISVTPEIEKQFNNEVQQGGYMSKSELFRDMFRALEESRLRQQISQSQKEIVRGEGKKLKSLKELR